VVVGQFDSQFSPATFGDVVFTMPGFIDAQHAVVWKVNAEGITLWAVHGASSWWDNLVAVAVDGAGAVVATGQGLTLVHFSAELERFVWDMGRVGIV
jgi:hypothetical protein